MFDCEAREAAGHLPAVCPGDCAVCTNSLRSYLQNPETRNQIWCPAVDRLVLVEKRFLTVHVGVVDDWFAPRAPAVVFVGPHAKLVGGVGFQVIDDGFTGWAGLVDPLPVPLSVAYGVEPETGKRQIIIRKRKGNDPRTTEGVPQGSIFDPQQIHEDVSETSLDASLTSGNSSEEAKTKVTKQSKQTPTGSS